MVELAQLLVSGIVLVLLGLQLVGLCDVGHAKARHGQTQNRVNVNCFKA